MRNIDDLMTPEELAYDLFKGLPDYELNINTRWLKDVQSPPCRRYLGLARSEENFQKGLFSSLRGDSLRRRVVLLDD